MPWSQIRIQLCAATHQRSERILNKWNCNMRMGMDNWSLAFFMWFKASPMDLSIQVYSAVKLSLQRSFQCIIIATSKIIWLSGVDVFKISRPFYHFVLIQILFSITIKYLITQVWAKHFLVSKVKIPTNKRWNGRILHTTYILWGVSTCFVSFLIYIHHFESSTFANVIRFRCKCNNKWCGLSIIKLLFY